MGLAERFKDKLDKKDIFSYKEIEKNLDNQNIKFISKPENKDIITCPNISTDKVILNELPLANSNNKYEDLEVEIIAKIRKTPYWEDFSTDRQASMISKYFDIKTINLDNVTIEDKQKFIENIIILANNR